MISDPRFFGPTLTAIQSICDSKSTDLLYTIYVVCVDIDPKSKSLLLSLQRPDLIIQIIDTNTDKYARFKKSESLTFSNVSIADLLKFDLPDLIEEDKILYLDGDIVVKKDLADLYNTDIQGYYLAAIPDSGSLYVKRDSIYSPDEYFNCGILLLNLDALRKDHMGEKLFQQKLELKDPRLMDQNVFNLVMRGHVKFLPIKYNFLYVNLARAAHLWTFEELNRKYNTSYSSLEEIAEEAYIIHYASKEKPWSFPETPAADEWKKVFDRLQKNLQGSECYSFFKEVIEKYYRAEQIKGTNIDSNNTDVVFLQSELQKLSEENRTINKELSDIKGSKAYALSKSLEAPYHFIKKLIRKK